MSNYRSNPYDRRGRCNDHSAHNDHDNNYGSNYKHHHHKPRRRHRYPCPPPSFCPNPLFGPMSPFDPMSPRSPIAAPLGPTGPIGEIGPTGVAGPMSIGPMGPTGPAGPVGDAGDANVMGLAGETGPAGVLAATNAFALVTANPTTLNQDTPNATISINEEAASIGITVASPTITFVEPGTYIVRLISTVDPSNNVPAATNITIIPTITDGTANPATVSTATLVADTRPSANYEGIIITTAPNATIQFDVALNPAPSVTTGNITIDPAHIVAYRII